MLSKRQLQYLAAQYSKFSDHKLANALQTRWDTVADALTKMHLRRSQDDLSWIQAHPQDEPPRYRSQICPPREMREPGLLDFATAIGATIAVLGVYLSTLPHTVTGEDSGEFITAAYTLGIPHPPGYPLWTLLAHAFTYIPVFTVAWRVAFFSAVCTSIAVFLLALMVIKITSSRSGGVAAALIFAFASEVWEQSVIAEVYGLNIALTAGCLYCLLLWYATRQDWHLLVFSLLYGLSLTNHSTARILGPVFVLFVLYLEPMIWKRWRMCLGCIGLALLGLSVYLYLPIRSRMNPFLDWGDPENLRNLIAVIRQEQFSFLLSEHERTPQLLFNQLRVFLTNWAFAFTYWLLPFTFLGIVILREYDRTIWKGCVVLTAVFSVGIIFALNYGTDKQARWVNHVFFIPFYFIAAALTGSVVAWLATLRIRRFPLAPVAAAAGIGAGLLLTFTHYTTNDKSQYWFADDFNRNILNSLARNALYLPSADHATFPAMYLQQVEGVRPDIEIADKYGYIEPHLYEDMPKEIREMFHRIPTAPETNAIENWIVSRDNRPVYITTKRSFETPAGTTVDPFGLVYRVLRPNESGDAAPPWSAYSWHTVEPKDTRGEYTAELILGDYWFAKGRELLQVGDTEKGVAALQKVAEIEGDSMEVLNNLGSACADVGQLEPAADFYARAVKADPDYVTALRNLARVEWSMKRYDDLLQTTGRIVTLNKADYETHWYRGGAQRQLGLADDAIKTYYRLLQYNPQDADAYRELGLVYLELKNDRKAAEDALRRSFAIDSNQPELIARVQEHGLNMRPEGTASPTPTEALTPPTIADPTPMLPQPPNPTSQLQIQQPLLPAVPRQP